jgi:enterochelin esterase-like enzyme
LFIFLAFLMAGCELFLQTPAATPSPTQSADPSNLPVPTPTPSVTPARPSPTPTSACSGQTGRVESGSLPAKGLFQSKLDYRIYLPPCYDSGRDHYPVLYLFHGLYFENDQWERIGAVEVADTLIANGEITPFIMVFPYDPTYREPSEYGFDEAILEVLIPYIDEAYRTIPERLYRAAGGLSRGGGWAIHFAFTQPDLFGAVGGHSPIVLYEDGATLSGVLKKIPQGQMPRIYLDIGDKDSESFSVTWLDGLLKDMDFPHEYHVYPGQHNEDYWSAHVEEYIRWYAAGWER